MSIRLAFLWHMHQPMYVAPATGEVILPWVRFHATHAYYDMARVLERHPGVRATVNFVPSLVEQLDDVAARRRPERFLSLTERRPADLTEAERLFVIRHFFMVSHERAVLPVPRYAELHARRESPDGFSDDDVRDLQVLFNLAWMGFSARADEPEIARLVEKGSAYDDADKEALLAAQQDLVRRVLPLWRRLAERGQVEVSATPYYHPILPLVIDTETARRCQPEASLPPRFAWPDDAREHVRRAIARHERTFGVRPVGMWPAEGSVSPEAAALFASEGIRWIATDEGILQRSSPPPTARGELYQPWRLTTTGGDPLALVFRDHALSDRIGFTYARQDPTAAVADFLASVKHAARDAAAAGIVDPLVPVVLDGENAWEHYANRGREFLDALHGALERAEGIRTVTLEEGSRVGGGRLTRLHSGSWIDSSYRIWIGHAEDNLAWSLLGRVREIVADHAARADVAPDALTEAREWLLQAEGSDWFWWYGDDFTTDNAAEFDQLFRDRLLRALALVGEPPLPRLLEPLSAQARTQRTKAGIAEMPHTLIEPRIDGRGESWVEWLGAIVHRPGQAHGSMYQATAHLREVHLGCGREALYLRLDPEQPLEGIAISVEVTGARGAHTQFVVPEGARGLLQLPVAGARAARGHVLEVALPYEALGLAPREISGVSVSLRRGSIQVERIPAAGNLPFIVPDVDFEGRDWVV